MNAFFVSIAYNLRRLIDFRGRESQILFWPYAGFIYGLTTVVTTGLTMFPIMETTMRAMQQVAAAANQGGNAEPAFIKSPEMLMPDMSGLAIPIIAVDLLAIALLASAIVRRLHDKDRSGFWALLPLPTTLLGLALMPASLDEMFVTGREPSPLLALVMLNNVVSFGLLILLVVMLVGKGSGDRSAPNVP